MIVMLKKRLTRCSLKRQICSSSFNESLHVGSAPNTHSEYHLCCLTHFSLWCCRRGWHRAAFPWESPLVKHTEGKMQEALLYRGRRVSLSFSMALKWQSWFYHCNRFSDLSRITNTDLINIEKHCYPTYASRVVN